MLQEPSQLSNSLKKKRTRLGKTQGKIADITGLSVSQISRIENNDTNYSYSAAYELWKTLNQLEGDIETAEEVMNPEIHWAEPEMTVLEVRKIMRENDYSQLPVKENGEQIGRIDSKTLLESNNPDQKIQAFLGPEYTEINPEMPLKAFKEIIRQDSAVLVKKDGEYQGLVTRADVI